MKILFLTRRAWPEIGGVEKHIEEISKALRKKGHSVKIISEKDIKYPHIKFLGLLFIWLWFWKNRRLFRTNELIHCHDVFIWYLPFRFLYPKKKVFTTIHGLEWDNPLNPVSLWQKRMSVKLSTGTIGVGKFLEKYLGIKFNLLIYGAFSMIRIIEKIKKEQRIVYIGRLEENTGLLKFLKEVKTKKTKSKIDFVGDGRLRGECQKYGTVHGFVKDVAPYLIKARYCVPGGYLAALEGLSYGCELKLYWSDKVKENYWKMSPFYQKDVKVWAKFQTWTKLANEYLGLYNNI